MTTPAGPDGQTPPTTPPTNSPAGTPPADGEAIRNWEDAKKGFVARDEFKAESKELRTLLEAVVQKLDKIGTPAAPADGTPPAGTPAPGSVEAQIAELAKVVGSLATDKNDTIKAQRRKAVEDTVIAAAKESDRALIRGELAMLALDGVVDLYAEDSAGQVTKALDKLRASRPGSFAQPTGSAPAASGEHNLIPPGTPLHELTAEQLARLSDEEFSKARRAARTSKLAV